MTSLSPSLHPPHANACTRTKSNERKKQASSLFMQEEDERGRQASKPTSLALSSLLLPLLRAVLPGCFDEHALKTPRIPPLTSKNPLIILHQQRGSGETREGGRQLAGNQRKRERERRSLSFPPTTLRPTQCTHCQRWRRRRSGKQSKQAHYCTNQTEPPTILLSFFFQTQPNHRYMAISYDCSALTHSGSASPFSSSIHDHTHQDCMECLNI